MTAEEDNRICQPSEILRCYRNGERDFRGLEIESSRGSIDPGFRGATLASADFSESFIVADFRGADLQNSKFATANVKTCSFDGADLRSADFSGAAIDSATFDGADLTGTNFEGAGAYGYTYENGERPGSERRPTSRCS